LCADFIFYSAHTNGESYSGDGLIVAKRDGVEGPEYIEIQRLGVN
jgi:hypothetical protein